MAVNDTWTPLTEIAAGEPSLSEFNAQNRDNLYVFEKVLFDGDGSASGKVHRHGTGTFANRPTVGNAGRTYFATDIGDTGVLYLDNGTKWLAVTPLTVTKPSNQPKTTDTTTVKDSALYFTIAASEKWQIELLLFWQAHVDGDILMTIDAPSGATGRWGLSRQQGTSTLFPTYMGLGLGTDQGIEADAGSVVRGAHIFGVVHNSTTPGTVDFAWAQASSHATATTILDYSILVARQIG